MLVSRPKRASTAQQPVQSRLSSRRLATPKTAGGKSPPAAPARSLNDTFSAARRVRAVSAMGSVRSALKETSRKARVATPPRASGSAATRLHARDSFFRPCIASTAACRRG